MIVVAVDEVAELAEMRTWLRDLGVEDVAYLPDEDVRAAIKAEYDGGIAQFRADGHRGGR
jgi:hypothetical protein